MDEDLVLGGVDGRTQVESEEGVSLYKSRHVRKTSREAGRKLSRWGGFRTTGDMRIVQTGFESEFPRPVRVFVTR